MTTARIAARASLFAVLAPGSVTVLGPSLILQAERGTSLPVGPARFVGVGPIVIGATVLTWCIVDFVRSGRGTPAPWDAPRHLVTRGVYRVVRNPMYVGIVCTLVGEALLFRSAWILGYATVVWLVFHLFVTVYEEPALRRQFGRGYVEYCASVKRWIPRPPGPVAIPRTDSR
jgi:protein-S-isoprenylcysteine O-methyltransferase Ste14